MRLDDVPLGLGGVPLLPGKMPFLESELAAAIQGTFYIQLRDCFSYLEPAPSVLGPSAASVMQRLL